MYGVGIVVLFFGLSYAAVPAYRMFCQATGAGGAISSIRKGKHVDSDKIDTMAVSKNRLIKIRFEADVDARMSWDFKPLQNEIWVHPGETALAFYSAKNDTVNPIVGISTYSIVPFDAGKFFSKIQCFCFDEQMLNPGEELDMPVFFYIDPEFENDSRMDYVDEIVLSYTFFESTKDEKILQPFRKSLFWPKAKPEILTPAT
jgi:cytochrome c oxidase assembly protein subunit 11